MVQCLSKVIRLPESVKKFVKSREFSETYLPARMRFVGNALVFLADASSETSSALERFKKACSSSLTKISQDIGQELKRKVPSGTTSRTTIEKMFIGKLRDTLVEYILAGLLNRGSISVDENDVYHSFHAMGFATGSSHVKTTCDKLSVEFDTTERATVIAVQQYLVENGNNMKVSLTKALLKGNKLQEDRTLLEKAIGIQLLGNAEPLAKILLAKGSIGADTKISVQKMGTASELFPDINEGEIWNGILAGDPKFFNVVIFFSVSNHLDVVLAEKSMINGKPKISLTLISSKALTTADGNGFRASFVKSALSTNPFLMYKDGYAATLSLEHLKKEARGFDRRHAPFDNWSAFQSQFTAMVNSGELQYHRILVHAHPDMVVKKEWKSDKFIVVDSSSHAVLFEEGCWEAVMEWLGSMTGG